MVGMRGMIDWQGLAQRKYNIMQQGANADSSRAGTARLQANTQASLAPSAIAGAEADAAVARARAAGMPALINSEIGMNTANAGLIGANATGQRINNNAMRRVFSTEDIAAMAQWLGSPALSQGTLPSANFTATPAPLSTIETDDAPATPRQRRVGGFSVTEDENTGVTVRRGLGMF
jgi:hypothetical protein